MIKMRESNSMQAAFFQLAFWITTMGMLAAVGAVALIVYLIKPSLVLAPSEPSNIIKRTPRHRPHHRGVAIAAFIIVAATIASEIVAGIDWTFFYVANAAIFAPTFIAAARSHKNTTAIFVANLLMFGSVMFPDLDYEMTKLAMIGAGAGWVITTIWAFTANRD